jgi:hypothetical protein
MYSLHVLVDAISSGVRLADASFPYFHNNKNTLIDQMAIISIISLLFAQRNIIMLKLINSCILRAL